jgi:4-diphosphocytidyl-2-C-methyl-D-erythritol kinase
VTRRQAAAGWGEARAKVNLALAVTGRRVDGFHTLDSVFLRLLLHDHLEVTFASHPDGPDELDVRGDTGGPTAEDLVLRAAAHLREVVGPRAPALHFRLEKDIPVAAGLAGGSADAALALELAGRMWGLAREDERIGHVALGLGADVPFCLSRAAAARVGGIGEQVAALPAPTTALGVLLVTPAVAQSTRHIFTAFDGLEAAGSIEDPVTPDPRSAHEAVVTLAAALAAGASAAQISDLAPALRDANDLWPAAASVLPSLVPLREALEAVLGRPVLMTGSGATLLALYPSPQEAVRGASSLTRAGPREADGVRVIATASILPGGAQ